MSREDLEAVFKVESELRNQGYDLVIGIDEAGRGPLAGPVVASACALRTSDVPNGHPMSKLIRDSKKLSEKQREKVYDFILENFYVGVGICDHETIDRVNILEATYLAMKKAIGELMRALPASQPLRPEYGTPPLGTGEGVKCIVLVDGNKAIPNLSFEQRAVIGGDKFVKSISAASIIAKVTRDRMMKECHEKYPQYNFSKHKGYGTVEHMAALKKNGPCEIHRRSFRPVREAIEMYKSVISNY